jgi:hypothetical protein
MPHGDTTAGGISRALDAPPAAHSWLVRVREAWRLRVERARWRAARRHLRRAGALLAPSDGMVLYVQTSGIVDAAPDPTWPTLTRLAVRPPRATPMETVAHLSRADAHGLLLQLARASHLADLAHERNALARAEHRRGNP